MKLWLIMNRHKVAETRRFIRNSDSRQLMFKYVSETPKMDQNI